MATFQEVRIPFQNMSYTPDVPATALSANEYNAGDNIETDVRGIRSVAGDEAILATVPGTPTFITGGYRADTKFWFIVATTEGRYWASNGVNDGGAWRDITPNGTPLSGYAQNTNITESWNGNVVFFNDSFNPPMFWPDAPDAILVMYSNQVPLDIKSIAPGSTLGTNVITFVDNELGAPPFDVGSYILISGIVNPAPIQLNGQFLVIACTNTTVTYASLGAGSYTWNSTIGYPSVAPLYTWNYNPKWKGLFAGWMRLYSTPNVGCILVAGNLTATDLYDVVTNYPVTIQWSQAFGLNQAPTSWTPTITNVANQLEVPLRGPAVDAFPSGGNLYLCSYWDTVVFSPLNYSTTSAPIIGVRLYNQGRGMLSSNCWANADDRVFGIDARDIWVFDGNNFKGLGNQRVKNWFFDQLDPRYVDRVWMENNSEKSQIEIYYSTVDAINGVPNKMLSYRYDLDIFNAPRDISSATFSCESPIWSYVDSEWTSNYGSRTIVYARGIIDSQIVQKDQGFSFLDGAPISSYFARDNIKILDKYSGHLLVHRILPETVNLDNHSVPITPSPGNITVTVSGSNSVGSEPIPRPAVTIPIATNNPWAQINQNAFRVNRLELSNSSNTDIWMCNATSWQFTQVEDDR